MKSSVERAVYRSLLRCCLEADRNPAFLVTLMGRPTRLYDWGEGQVMREPPSKQPFVDDAVWTAIGGSTQYAHPNGSAARAAREHYRRSKILNLPYLADAKELLRRFEQARKDADNLGVVQQPKEANPDSVPERTLRVLEGPSKFLRFEPNETTSIASGDILVSHPVSSVHQSIFDNSIILLTKVNRAAGFVEGLVLNKRLHEVHPGIFPGLSDLTAVVDEDDVYFGGPVMAKTGVESLVWLHTYGKNVSDSLQVLPTVWSEGDLTAIQTLAVAASDKKPTGLRFFLGRSAWALSQLEVELERGVWVRMRADDLTVHDLCFGPIDSRGSWQSAMHNAGMPALAEFPRGQKADKMLKKIEVRYLEALEKSQGK